VATFAGRSGIRHLGGRLLPLNLYGNSVGPKLHGFQEAAIEHTLAMITIGAGFRREGLI